MSGKVHYEGHTYFSTTALKGQALYLGLYTNATALAKGNTMANITEVTGGGYARIALNAVDWTEDATKTASLGTLFAQPRKTFLFSAAVGNVTGYFITTDLTGTTGKLISSEHFPSAVDVNQPDFEIRVTAKQEYV